MNAFVIEPVYGLIIAIMVLWVGAHLTRRIPFLAPVPADQSRGVQGLNESTLRPPGSTTTTEDSGTGLQSSLMSVSGSETTAHASFEKRRSSGWTS